MKGSVVVVSEKQFQAQVLDLARLSGWLCYLWRPRDLEEIQTLLKIGA